MPRFRVSTKLAAGLGLIIALGSTSQPLAYGQGAVAYSPQIGFVPNGATLSVTPAVSADRRYVRLSVNPYFNTVNGFTTYTSPLAAVGGGGAGGFAGMNGIMGGGGGIGGGLSASPMGMPYTGTYLAGDYPPSIATLQQGSGNNGFAASGNRFEAPNAGIIGGFGSDAFVPNQAELSRSDEDPSPRATTRRSKTARAKALGKLRSIRQESTKTPRRN